MLMLTIMRDNVKWLLGDIHIFLYSNSCSDYYTPSIRIDAFPPTIRPLARSSI
jgi:hypothetical protein